MSWLSFHLISLLFAATAFSRMLLFMLCFAPARFSALERPRASQLMRHLFLRYYFILSIILLLAAGFLVPGGSYELKIAIFIGCVGVLHALQNILLPRMEALREATQIAFNRMHRTSVVVNLAQLAAVTVALIRLAQ
tara:strand:+ start:1056 stop:1466 length:411 start_codon:yes stop_codon:yes gene_type:complete